MLRSLARVVSSQQATTAGRRTTKTRPPPLGVEALEDRCVPATLQIVDGLLTYTASSGNDTIDTQLVNTVPQHDLTEVTVNGWVGADQFLLFTSDQSGGTSPTPSGTASG